MKYSLLELKQDVRIGSRRAFRDFFAPVTGLTRWILRCADEASERHICEAREICERHRRADRAP